MTTLLKATKENKNKALGKMLEEMNEKHSSAEDAIHNWLCDQDDPELIDGILKEGRTIKKAMSYVMTQAKKEAENGAAMIADETVYKWVRKYFVSKNEPKTEDVKATVTISKKTKKVEKKNPVAPPEARNDIYDNGDEQMNLLDFL